MLVSFHRLARLEFNEASQYYEHESPGLGQAFLAEVERGTDEIIRNPAAGLAVRGAIRRRLIRRFPYALLYKCVIVRDSHFGCDESETSARLLGGPDLKRRRDV